MKYKLLSILLFFPLMSSANNDEKIDFLNQFVQGNYELVGKAINTNQTYYGSVHISQQEGSLMINRDINGKQTLGTAVIEPTASGEAVVMRMRFAENETKYEETCMVDSDLDNYARISCHLYLKNGKTKEPGLETLFTKHH